MNDQFNCLNEVILVPQAAFLFDNFVLQGDNYSEPERDPNSQ
jgi:hypothetical protein